MRIDEILASGERPTFSFEFFPPRTPEGEDNLYRALAALRPLAPDFVSVTYGAGGSTRDRTHNLVTRLQRETKLDPVPHLTCVCHTAHEIETILERYIEAGVDNLMALRGDPPRDLPSYDRSRDHFQHAADLVAFIRRFGERSGRAFGLGVAGFPEGHPDTPNQLLQMDHLKAKVEAGADYICTQLFFDNHEFYDWSERCKLAGIKVPLVAGIMPIASIGGMRRMADLAGGTKFPAALLKQIYRCQNDPEAVARVGTHWATEQCRDLIDHGVQGIHFYTLNRSDATRRIYETLGAKNSAGLR